MGSRIDIKVFLVSSDPSEQLVILKTKREAADYGIGNNSYNMRIPPPL